MPKYYEGEAVVNAFTETTNQSATWARGILANMKEADVEPVVHAHWIRRFCDHRNDYLDVLEYPYRCSWCRVKNKEITKRCPECGARMDGEIE